MKESNSPAEEWVLEHVQEDFSAELDYVLPHGALLKRFFAGQDSRSRQMNRYLGIPRLEGLLFCGPSGCGKLSTALYLAQELRKCGYHRMVYIAGVQLGSGKKQVLERLRALMQLGSEQHPVCLILDQLSDCRWGRQARDWIANLFKETEVAGILPILLETDTAFFRSTLCREFLTITFTLPNFDERSAYLRAKLNIPLYPSEGEVRHAAVSLRDSSVEDLARETEGFNYQQLEYVICYITLLLRDMACEDSGVEPEEALDDLIRGNIYRVRASSLRPIIPLLRTAATDSPIIAPPRAPQDGSPPTRPVISAPLSAPQEADQKVLDAANGKEKDIPFLMQRYLSPLYEADEFGKP